VLAIRDATPLQQGGDPPTAGGRTMNRYALVNKYSKRVPSLEHFRGIVKDWRWGIGRLKGGRACRASVPCRTWGTGVSAGGKIGVGEWGKGRVSSVEGRVRRGYVHGHISGARAVGAARCLGEQGRRP